MAFLVLAGCQSAFSEELEGFQGVVEFDERDLAFESGGRVLEVKVDEGDAVEIEQVVASLDDRVERANRASHAEERHVAQARLELLQAGSRREDIAAMAARVSAARAVEERVAHNLERERQLSQEGITPRSVVADLDKDLERARAERQALEQSLQALKKGARGEEVRGARSQVEAIEAALIAEDARLARYRLKAPIGGEVLDVHVEPGEVVAAGVPVLTLGDVDHPYADVFVPQERMAGIAVGKPATLETDAHEKSFAGRVEHVSRRLEFTPRFVFSERERANMVVRVRLRINDPKHELTAGIPVFAKIAP